MAAKKNDAEVDKFWRKGMKCFFQPGPGPESESESERQDRDQDGWPGPVGVPKTASAEAAISGVPGIDGMAAAAAAAAAVCWQFVFLGGAKEERRASPQVAGRGHLVYFSFEELAKQSGDAAPNHFLEVCSVLIENEKWQMVMSNTA